MECEHKSDDVEVMFTQFWEKDKEGNVVKEVTNMSGYRCICGKKVYPETFKALDEETIALGVIQDFTEFSSQEVIGEGN
jgi:hypothetical protein